MDESTKGKNIKGRGARRNGRVLAFQVLFGQGFNPTIGEQAIRKAFVQNPAVLEDENETAREFAMELLLGVAAHAEELDQVIERFSQNWKIARIAKIEISILRLSIYEMMYSDTPLKVAINEGVELSKRFGDGNSKGFINGILDAAARDVDAGKLGISKRF